jgi:hypothetical protein
MRRLSPPCRHRTRFRVATLHAMVITATIRPSAPILALSRSRLPQRPQVQILSGARVRPAPSSGFAPRLPPADNAPSNSRCSAISTARASPRSRAAARTAAERRPCRQRALRDCSKPVAVFGPVAGAAMHPAPPCGHCRPPARQAAPASRTATGRGIRSVQRSLPRLGAGRRGFIARNRGLPLQRLPRLPRRPLRRSPGRRRC